MKAVICTKYGSPEVLKVVELEKPVAKDKEVLVRIMATAVNSGDVRVRGLAVSGWQRVIMRLVLGFNRPRKQVLGTVLSGVVESAGSKVTKFKMGDEIYAMTGFKFGTYAEYVTLNEDSPIVLKPSNATFEEAAAIPFGGSAAMYFLNKAKIGGKGNQKVLIYGATGAVGVAAVQIAKYYGAIVTAVCGEEGEGIVKSIGADKVILYTKEDFTKNGDTYDIIFDAVGKKPKQECVGSLEKDGVYVSVAGFDIASETREQLEFLKKLFEEKKYQAVIDRTYDLDNIVEAHKYVDSGKKKGNVVVKVCSLL